MRDWWLTWRPVCDCKAVTERRNAKTKLPGEQDIGRKFPPLKNLVGQIHPWISEYDPSRQLWYTRRKYTIEIYCTDRVSTECMRFFVSCALGNKR